MNKITKLILALLFLNGIFAFGQEGIQSKSYTERTISEKSYYYELEAKYPYFKNYPAFSTQIMQAILEEYNSYLTMFDEFGGDISDLGFYIDYEVYESKNYISVIIYYLENGVGHGSNWALLTFNLDKRTGKSPSITELSGKTYSQLATECRKSLTKTYEDNEYYLYYFIEKTKPDAENFTKFIIDENKIKILYTHWSFDYQRVTTVELPLKK